jgi:hypothetical protein
MRNGIRLDGHLKSIRQDSKTARQRRLTSLFEVGGESWQEIGQGIGMTCHIQDTTREPAGYNEYCLLGGVIQSGSASRHDDHRAGTIILTPFASSAAAILHSSCTLAASTSPFNPTSYSNGCPLRAYYAILLSKSLTLNGEVHTKCCQVSVLPCLRFRIRIVEVNMDENRYAGRAPDPMQLLKDWTFKIKLLPPH